MAHSMVHDVVFRKRGSTDGQIYSIAELALDMAGGTSITDLAPLIETTAQEIASSVRPRMKWRLERHLEDGDICVLLSASPQPLVERIAELLAIPTGIGTIVEDDGGVLTGRIVPPMCYGPGKLERLSAVMGSVRARHEGASYAYADSMSDLPLLESVESPVVVAPDRKLRRLAADRNWPIIDC